VTVAGQAELSAADDAFVEWLEAQYQAGASYAEIEAAIELRHAEHMKRLHAGFAAWDAAERAADADPADIEAEEARRAAQVAVLAISDGYPPIPPPTPTQARPRRVHAAGHRRRASSRPRRRRRAATRAAGIRSGQDPGDPDPAEDDPDPQPVAKSRHRFAVQAVTPLSSTELLDSLSVHSAAQAAAVA
jgi:hypothetical protein